jgi:hypothetical protein
MDRSARDSGLRPSRGPGTGVEGRALLPEPVGYWDAPLMALSAEIVGARRPERERLGPC